MASVSKNLKSLPITTKWRFDKRNLLCDVISTKNIYIKRIVVRLCVKESSFWRKKCNVLLSIVQLFNNKKYFWHLLLFFIQELPHNLAVIWGIVLVVVFIMYQGLSTFKFVGDLWQIGFLRVFLHQYNWTIVECDVKHR
jgi:hypothetical protein